MWCLRYARDKTNIQTDIRIRLRKMPDIRQQVLAISDWWQRKKGKAGENWNVAYMWTVVTTTTTTRQRQRQRQQLLLQHPLNGLFSRTTWISRYQKSKTSLDLNEARDEVLGWQWHQLDHMQTICSLLQTDNHTNTPSLNVYTPDALPDAQPTLSKHWRQSDLSWQIQIEQQAGWRVSWTCPDM